MIVEFRPAADLAVEEEEGVDPDLARVKGRVDHTAALSKALMRDLASFKPELVRTFKHLPYMVVRVRSEHALTQIAANKGVAHVWENQKYAPAAASTLTNSVPTGGGYTVNPMGWGRTDSASAAGDGSGARVAVLDTGLDYAALRRSTTSIALTAKPADGDTVTLDAGPAPVTFEFDSNSIVTSGNTAVALGADAAATALSLSNAINNSTATVAAWVNSTAPSTVELQHDVLGADTGTVTDASAGTDVITTADFAGGNSGSEPFGPCQTDSAITLNNNVASVTLNGQSSTSTAGYNVTGVNVTGTGCVVKALYEVGSKDDDATSAVADHLDTASDGSDGVDGTGHGTQMAAIIGAIAPQAEIYGFDVFDKNATLAQEADVLAAMDIVYDLDVAGTAFHAINLSLAGVRGNQGCSSSLTTAINNLRTRGIATVAPAGDVSSGSGSSSQLATPACVTNAISAGSIDVATNDVTQSTNSATFMTVYAPGAGIDIPMFSQTGLQGSSFAAAHVTGAIAVLAGNGYVDAGEGASGRGDDVAFWAKRLKETGAAVTARTGGAAYAARPRVRLAAANASNFCTMRLMNGSTEVTSVTLPSAAGPASALTVQFNKAGCTLDMQATSSGAGAATFANYDLATTPAVTGKQVSTTLTQDPVSGSSATLTFVSRAYVNSSGPKTGTLRIGADAIQPAGAPSSLANYETITLTQSGDQTKPAVSGSLGLLGLTNSAGGSGVYCSNAPTTSGGAALYTSCVSVVGQRAFVQTTRSNGSPATTGWVYIDLSGVSATEAATGGGNLSYCIANSPSCSTWTALSATTFSGASVAGSAVTGDSTVAGVVAHRLTTGEGEKTVYLLIKDAAGNTDTSRLLRFTVDAADPTSPTLTVSPTFDSLNVSWTNPTDPSTITAVNLYDITATPSATCASPGAAKLLGSKGGAQATGSITTVDATAEGATFTVGDGISAVETFELDCDNNVSGTNNKVSMGACAAAQATGSIDVTGMTGDDLDDGETFTLSDGVNLAVVEFDDNTSGQANGVSSDATVVFTKSLQAVSVLQVDADNDSDSSDGQTFQLNSVVYELDSDATPGENGGTVNVTIASTLSAANIAQAITDAINGAVNVVSAVRDGITVVITADNGGAAGNTATALTNPDTSFSLPSAGTVVGSDASTEIEIAAAIEAAINGSSLDITATAVGTNGLVNLQNDNTGTVGNQDVLEDVADDDFVVTGMAGGAASAHDLAVAVADAISLSGLELTASVDDNVSDISVSLLADSESADSNVAMAGAATGFTFSGMSGGVADVTGNSFEYANTAGSSNVAQNVSKTFMLCVTDGAGRTSATTTASGAPRADVQIPYIYTAALMTNDAAPLTGLNCGGNEAAPAAVNTCGFKGCSGATAGTTQGMACHPLAGIGSPFFDDVTEVALGCPVYDVNGNITGTAAADCTIDYSQTQTIRATGMVRIAPSTLEPDAGFCSLAAPKRLADLQSGGLGVVACNVATEDADCGDGAGLPDTGTCDQADANAVVAGRLTCNSASGPSLVKRDCTTNADCSPGLCNVPAETAGLLNGTDAPTELDGQYFTVGGSTYEFDSTGFMNGNRYQTNVKPGHRAITITAHMSMSELTGAAMAAVQAEAYTTGDAFALWFHKIEATVANLVAAYYGAGLLTVPSLDLLNTYNVGRMYIVSNARTGTLGNAIPLSVTGSRLAAATSTAGTLYAGTNPTYFTNDANLRLTLTWIDLDPDGFAGQQHASDVTHMCFADSDAACGTSTSVCNSSSGTNTNKPCTVANSATVCGAAGRCTASDDSNAWKPVTNGANILATPANSGYSFCTSDAGLPMPRVCGGSAVLASIFGSAGPDVTCGGTETCDDVGTVTSFAAALDAQLGTGTAAGLGAAGVKICATSSVAQFTFCDQSLTNASTGLNTACASTFGPTTCNNQVGILKTLVMPADTLNLTRGGVTNQSEKNWYVKVKDAAGNQSPSWLLKVRYDITPPSNGNITLTPGAKYNTLSFTNVSDGGSGLMGYKIVSDSTTNPADCSGTALTGFDYVNTALPLDMSGATVSTADDPAVVAGGTVLSVASLTAPASGKCTTVGGTGAITLYATCDDNTDCNNGSATNGVCTNPRGLVYKGWGLGSTATASTDLTRYRVCVKDKAGNVSSGMTTSGVVRDNLVAPEVSGVLISAGAIWTKNINEDLAFTVGAGDTDVFGQAAVDGASDGTGLQYCAIGYSAKAGATPPSSTICAWKSTLAGAVSGSVGEPGGSLQLGLNTAKSQLPDPNGIKDIMVWVRDQWGNVSAPSRDFLNQPFSSSGNKGGGINVDRVAPPIGTATAQRSGGQIRISWTGNSETSTLANPQVGMVNNAAGWKTFKVYAALNGVIPGPSVCSGLAPGKNNGSGGGTAESQCSGNSLNNCYVCSGTSTSSSCNYTFPSSTTTQTYSFRVCAVDAQGNYNNGDTVSNKDRDELTCASGPNVGKPCAVASSASICGSAGLCTQNDPTGHDSIVITP